MNRIEQLIEDYLKRIETTEELIEENEYLIKVTVFANCRPFFDKRARLETKLECYKSFIAELQRIVN
jgi:hypothetical protein